MVRPNSDYAFVRCLKLGVYEKKCLNRCLHVCLSVNKVTFSQDFFFRTLLLRPIAFLSLANKNMLIRSHQISMENDYLGPRRIEALKKEDFDWQKKAQEAVLNIQEFTVKYFETTARAQKGTVCHHCHYQCQVNEAADE